MRKITIFLLTLLISSQLLSNEMCDGMQWDGEGPVEIEVTVYEPWSNYVSGANVRFIKIGRKGDATKEEWNSVVPEHAVEGITDASGGTKLSPILQLHGFDPVSGGLESCEESTGFYGGDVYLLVQKAGYHTYSVELSSLIIKSSFKKGEKVKGRIIVNLLPKRI
ncbi:hypothetical protein [Saccharophagus degradans]|uniref:Uncharacterized protein n=1 Tax=Saccharophagus degradans (strain 2-40 / ATCC 43961 / DSM 17024) TaxID=203122 RepID=Q21F13_SACD2|nr:hypothetical protein [Saccharophagus degradans]ABD82716.1 hypothetical protein Sde_3461 [Saccharophagus degradans 2-40]